MKKIVIILVSLIIMSFLIYGCNENEKQTNKNLSNGDNNFSGKTLSILVSQGWMEERYDDLIENFEEKYDVTVDVQTIPASQYDNLLQTKLANDTCADIFWLQSNPYQIEISIPNYEDTCIDFTNEKWKEKIPKELLSIAMVNDKLYGLPLISSSPVPVIVYNKTLFNELGIKETPHTYEELLTACEVLSNNNIIPWYMPGADGWRHQLTFVSLTGIFEEVTPGLIEKLNTNKITLADNKKMIEVLEQFKEVSEKGYFGEDWVGTDSTNCINELADRNYAMFACEANLIKQLEEQASDEFDTFLLPFGDNDYLPFNPAGPTMFGYKNTKNEELVRKFFDFICQTESIQSILDNAIDITNLSLNDEKVQQHWLKQEEKLMNSIPQDKKTAPYLHVGVKYCSEYYYELGNDIVSFCYGQISANDVLKNLDTNRAISAKLMKDPNWD